MKKLGQKGFTIFESLLIIIALSLVAGIGYYVYNINNNDKSKTSQANTSEITEKKPTETKKQYLVVEELGVKIPSETIKTISYQLSEGSSPDSKMYKFSDSEITKSVNACRLSGEKFNGYRVYEIFRGNGTFNPNTEGASTARLLKQFDTFYVAYIGQSNFSPCTDSSGTSVENPDITNALGKSQNLLSKAFESAEKL